jgi:pimeloyl-ACP methyl ester carboxylesterase
MTSRLPGFVLALAETASAVEFPMLLWRRADLLRQPRGHGEPVIVLPGFAADDMSTFVLRTYLRTIGYRVCGWGLGLNRGDVEAILPDVTKLVRKCADRHGQTVRLVGWSLGGVIAREVARDEPSLVERVVTMGSPVCGLRGTSSEHWLRLLGYDTDRIQAEIDRRNRIPLQVPCTAIYATYDGIVDRASCFDRWSEVEHVEVRTTHIGLGLNAEVYRIIAQRLALPGGARPSSSSSTVEIPLARTGTDG